MGINVNAGALTFGLTPEGALTKFLEPGLDWALHLGDRISALCAAPGMKLADVPEGSIQESIDSGTDANWNLAGENLTISCRAGQSGKIQLKKEGTLVSYLDGDAQPFAVVVPDGCVYVSLEFEVNLSAGGGAAFSAQGFGVKGNVSQSDTFVIANHRCFPASCKLMDALQEVFRKFTLPFQTQGILALAANDLVDFQFLGKLELGFGLTYGFSGAVLCGRSAGEVRRSFDTRLGGATLSANPTFSLNAGFAATYDHEDAFRFVFSRSPANAGNTTTLTILRADKREYSTSLTAGITLSAGLKVDLKASTENAVGHAVNHLFDQFDAGGNSAAARKLKAKLSGAGSAAVEKLTAAGNDAVNGFFDKAHGKAGIELAHENTVTNTALFQLDFDLADGQAAEAAIQLAMRGRIAQAAVAPVVTLRPGSLVEREARRRTAFTFQFFDLWKWQDADEYVEKVDVVYTGNNTLRLLATTGVKHSSGIVGHDSSCDAFFRAEALESLDAGSLDGLTVAFHFELIDRKRSRLLETARALRAIGSEDLAGAASRIENCAAIKDPYAKTACVISERAFGSLAVDRYSGDRPPAMPHENDARNYQRFANAALQVSGSWLGFATYDEWATFNNFANGREGGTAVPDRRNRGNLARWPDTFASPSDPLQRRSRCFSSDSARTFLNVCDDLRQLHEHLDEATTDGAFEVLLKDMNDIVKEVPESFLKATLVALVWCTGSTTGDVAVSTPGQPANVTFRVDSAGKPAKAASSAS